MAGSFSPGRGEGREVTRTARQILKVLVDLDAGKPEWEIRIRRTYAGYWQLACGAWKWVAQRFIREYPDQEYDEWMEICGSSDTCKDIIDAHRREDKYVSVYDGPAGRELIAEIKGTNKEGREE